MNENLLGFYLPDRRIFFCKNVSVSLVNLIICLLTTFVEITYFFGKRKCPFYDVHKFGFLLHKIFIAFYDGTKFQLSSQALDDVVVNCRTVCGPKILLSKQFLFNFLGKTFLVTRMLTGQVMRSNKTQ